MLVLGLPVIFQANGHTVIHFLYCNWYSDYTLYTKPQGLSIVADLFVVLPPPHLIQIHEESIVENTTLEWK